MNPSGSSRLWMVPLLAALVLATGCADAIIFATATETAIDINAAENAKQNVTVGYKRIEGVVMPVQKGGFLGLGRTKGPLRKEAFSVLAAMRYDTGSLFNTNLSGTHIKTVFATGRAAQVESAPAAIINTFGALSGDLISSNDFFLRKQLESSIDSLKEPKQTQAVRGAWSALGGGAGTSPNLPDYLMIMIGQETSKDSMAEMLKAVEASLADVAAGEQASVEMTDEIREDPENALRMLISRNSESGAEKPEALQAICDGLSGKVVGISDLVALSESLKDQNERAGAEKEMVIALADVAATTGDTTALQNALSGVLEMSRDG